MIVHRYPLEVLEVFYQRILFQMGDVLEIVNDEDATWWQALKVDDLVPTNVDVPAPVPVVPTRGAPPTTPGSGGTVTPVPARLVPSKHYQER